MTDTKHYEPAFVADRAGLAQLLGREEGREFVLRELISNAWDQRVTRVDVTLFRSEADLWHLAVEDDDPEGFADLTHAWTLFADTWKRGRADVRGRFNLGEKLAIAVCERAIISTTKGTVIFDERGRLATEAKRPHGSRFEGWLRLSDEEAGALRRAAGLLIPPRGIVTTLNGAELPQRLLVREFEAHLETELSAAPGRPLRRSWRNAKVRLYEPRADETAAIHELGVPVMEVGGRWHVDVLQKVPLALDRASVRAGFLRHLRAAVLNAAHDLLLDEDAAEEWIGDALEASEVTPEAVTAVVERRFGPKRVILDRSDPEANKRAVLEGYVVIPTRAFSKRGWQHVRDSGAALPAGRVTPSPKPYPDDPNAPPRRALPPEEWTPGMKRVVAYAQALARKLMGVTLAVSIVNDPECRGWGACYGRRAAGRGASAMEFNLTVLGRRFFENGLSEALDRLLIHEFGHEECADHLSEEFHEALCQIGARFARLALAEPAFFTPYREPWEDGA